MRSPVISGLLAAPEKGEALFDFAPWWVKLIVGVVMVVISGLIYLAQRRRNEHQGGRNERQSWSTGQWIQSFFGIFGVIVILQAIGVF